MSSENFKYQLFSQFARIGKALSNPYRLEILEFLAQKECNVDNLAKLTGLSMANASQHLQQLKQAGLVVARKEGQQVYYQLVDEQVVVLMSALRQVAENTLIEVQYLVNQFLTEKDSLEPITATELLARLQQGLVTVLDVRPAEEFTAGHLPGALNIPLQKLEEKWQTLPADQEFVAYCRGPYCILAYTAVAYLREKGLKIRRLVYGYPEWKYAGLPVQINEK